VLWLEAGPPVREGEDGALGDPAEALGSSAPAARKVRSSCFFRPSQSAEVRCRVGVTGLGFFSGVEGPLSSVENLKTRDRESEVQSHTHTHTDTHTHTPVYEIYIFFRGYFFTQTEIHLFRLIVHEHLS